MHGQYDAKATVAFPGAERHRLAASTKLSCLVIGVQGYELLAQSCYKAAPQPKLQPFNYKSKASPS